MKNYEEKEKKLDNVLKKLNTMSNRVVKMNNDINSLNIEKNQLLREKAESEKNFQKLSKALKTASGIKIRIRKSQQRS